MSFERRRLNPATEATQSWFNTESWREKKKNLGAYSMKEIYYFHGRFSTPAARMKLAEVKETCANGPSFGLLGKLMIHFHQNVLQNFGKAKERRRFQALHNN